MICPRLYIPLTIYRCRRCGVLLGQTSLSSRTAASKKLRLFENDTSHDAKAHRVKTADVLAHRPEMKRKLVAPHDGDVATKRRITVTIDVIIGPIPNMACQASLPTAQ